MDVLSSVTDPDEQQLAQALETWFVAQDAFLEYYELFEEEGAYPDLFGKSVLVSRSQFPHIHGLVQEISKFLDMEMPLVFVHESYQQVCDSEGLRCPRLELSARMIRNFSETELRHVLAKEMFHIKAGHIRYEVMSEKILGILNQAPNLPGLNLLKNLGGSTAAGFMSLTLRDTAFRWFRSACFSAENFAICYTGDIKASIDATLMTILNERELVNEVSLAWYVGQISRIESLQGPAATLEKINEVLPYGPYRILNMLRFVVSDRGQKFMEHCDRIVRNAKVG